MSLDIHHFTVGPFLEHTYIVSDFETKSAYVIDPGGENEKILKYLKEKDLRVLEILSTHGHIDHICGAYGLREATKAMYRLNERDNYWLKDLERVGSYFGLSEVQTPIVDSSVESGEVLPLGDRKLSVISTPGHTPGGLCFLIDGNIFVGDTLFHDSIGRTDLPGGNYDELIESIKTKLLALDDKLIVHCGHGPKTTIERERTKNPFLTKGQVHWSS